MNFFRKLFGKKSPASSFDAATPAPAAQPSGTGAPRPEEGVIRLFDAEGREVHVPKSEWRAKHLPAKLAELRDKPDQLASLVVQSLRDGFAAEVLDSAAHLAAADSDAERGHVLHASALLELRKPAEAEAVLRAFVDRHGETGAILANLAKARAAQNDDNAAADLLWRALRLDPNHDHALLWFVARQREKAGGDEADKAAEQAALEAFQRVAELPESWRARLWIARHHLTRRDLASALKLYEEALDLAPRPVPADFLQQMSGDLGNHAHLPEILHLVAPYYDVARHGLPTGLNILKAYHDLGQLDAAGRFLDRLRSYQRPDWRQAIAFWEAEIDKSRRAIDVAPPSPPRVTASVAPSARETSAPVPAFGARPQSTENIQVTLLAVEGPVWLPPESPAVELFPAKANDAPLVAILGSSAELPPPAAPSPEQARLADTAGRLSRALPLFLAEQIEFDTPALARVLVPWVVKPRPGFIVGGIPWDDATASRHARAVVPDDAADYLVVTHLRCVEATWSVELRFVRTIDAVCLGTASIPLSPEEPGRALPALAAALQELLSIHADIARAPQSPDTPLPAPSSDYLLRLEQLLAVRTAGIEPAKSTIKGEREILEGQLHLCLAQPDNLPARLLFAHTLKAMKRLRPEILPEFRTHADSLQNEKPLREPANSVVSRLFSESFSA